MIVMSIPSHSKQRRGTIVGEPGQDLLDLLSESLAKKWDLTVDMIVYKPEGDNRWQIVTKEKADELHINGKTIRDQLNLSLPDKLIDLNKIVSTLKDSKKTQKGYPLDPQGFNDGIERAGNMRREHEREKRPHDRFFPNENQVRAKNRDVKSFRRRIDDERTAKIKKEQDATDDSSEEETELPPEKKEHIMETIKNERKKPFFKKGRNQSNRKPDWKNFDDDDEDSDD